jgi:hypothetical protein
VDVDVGVDEDEDEDEDEDDDEGGAIRRRAVVVTMAGDGAAASAGSVRTRGAGAGASAGSFRTRGAGAGSGSGLPVSGVSVRAGAGAAAGSGAARSGASVAAGACARISAVTSGRPFIGGGAYASFDAMASEPREAFGDLATTAFVESSILFRSLDDGARLDLLQVGQIQSFSPDEVISTAADDRFFIVREGSAAVLTEGASGPLELYRLERGALFGVGRALGRGRVAWLQALTEVHVIFFPAPVVGVLAERFPKVKKLLEAVQAARNKEAAGRLAS